MGKRIIACLCIFLVFVGCSGRSSEIDPELATYLEKHIEFMDKFLSEEVEMTEEERKEYVDFFREHEPYIHEKLKNDEFNEIEKELIDSLTTQTTKDPENYPEAREKAAEYLNID